MRDKWFLLPFTALCPLKPFWGQKARATLIPPFAAAGALGPRCHVHARSDEKKERQDGSGTAEILSYRLWATVFHPSTKGVRCMPVTALPISME